MCSPAFAEILHILLPPVFIQSPIPQSDARIAHVTFSRDEAQTAAVSTNPYTCMIDASWGPKAVDRTESTPELRIDAGFGRWRKSEEEGPDVAPCTRWNARWHRHIRAISVREVEECNCLPREKKGRGEIQIIHTYTLTHPHTMLRSAEASFRLSYSVCMFSSTIRRENTHSKPHCDLGQVLLHTVSSNERIFPFSAKDHIHGMP